MILFFVEVNDLVSGRDDIAYSNSCYATNFGNLIPKVTERCIDKIQ